MVPMDPTKFQTIPTTHFHCRFECCHVGSFDHLGRDLYDHDNLDVRLSERRHKHLGRADLGPPHNNRVIYVWFAHTPKHDVKLNYVGTHQPSTVNIRLCSIPRSDSSSILSSVREATARRARNSAAKRSTALGALRVYLG